MVKKVNNYRLIKIITLVLMIFIFIKPQIILAAPVTETIDTQSDWLNGKFEFNSIDASTSAGFIHLGLDRGQWDASGPADLNFAITGPTKLIKVNQFYYLFRNANLGQFWRYDTETREWKEMAWTIIEPAEILDATTNGTDTIFAIATRSGRKHFMKYDIPTNSWSYLADLPNTLSANSASIEYVSGTTNYIYAVRGGNTYEFWKYAVNGDNANTWSNIQNNTARMDNYGDIIYDGSRYLYMATTWYSPDRFYQYDTWNGGAWVRKGDFPIDNAISIGSDLVRVGSDFYLLRTASTRSFYKYTASTNTWAAVADCPIPTYYAGTLEYDETNNRIVAVLDYGALLYYYPATNTWSQPLSGPLANSSNSSPAMTSDNAGNLYLCRGQGTTTCYKYVIATNTWTALTAAPVALYYISISYSNNKLYVTHYSPATLYSYDLTTNLWSTVTSTPTNFYYGNQLVASSSASIFALRGAGNANFYKYDGSSWTSKTNIPTATYFGSGMVQVGTAIYAMTGNNRGYFYRYDETPNTWTELAPIPAGTYIGASMTTDGVDKIYVTVGSDSNINGRQFYRYSIADNKWTRMADTPQITRNSSGMAYYDNQAYLYQGYSFGMYKYSTPSAEMTYTNYENDGNNITGSWFSQTYDLSGVESFDSFSASATTPDDTSVNYYSRTSDNQYVWDDWEEADSNINSVTRRYLQLKVVLKGPANRMESPKVDSINFTYTPDSTGPDLTSFSVTGKSTSSGTTLTSGETYSYTHPYFEWSGATDLLSTISGYYVYFGTNPDATPSTDGTYQNTGNYTVSSGLISGETYYLRIQAKDSQNNLSSTYSGFTYIYEGISPSTTSILTNQADWDSNEATRSAVYTSSTDWWNDSYLYRQQLNLSPTVASAAGSIIQVAVDTDALVTAGKLRSDRKDWRVIYKDGTIWKEIDRQYFKPTETYFALQRNINASGTDTNYYIYYGNSGETTSPMSDLTNSNSSSKWNSSLYFNGGTYLTLPNLINNLSQVTMEAWFKHLNPNGYRCIFGDSSNYARACIYSGQNYMSYYFRTTSGSLSNVTGTTWLEEGKWYHLAVTYDSTTNTFKTYVNGRLDYTSTALSGNINNAATQYLGYSSSGAFYGYVDEARISNNIRYTTDFTVPSTYFSTDANTLALYHLDETGGQYAYDSSGNNNNATWGSSIANTTGDPSTTGYYTAVVQTEETKPVTPSDNDLTLQSLTGGSYAGYQFSSLPYGARFHIGSGVYTNNAIYTLIGRTTRSFYKYDLTTTNWSQMADAPNTIYYNSMAYDGSNYIYALRGYNSTSFYRYDVAANTWDSSITQPTANFSTGSILIKGKDAEGVTVYFAINGGGGNGFYLYYPGENGGEWVSKTSPPGQSSYGSGMVYDEENKLIYLVTGSGWGFYKYSITDDVWDNTAVAPPFPPHPMGYASNNLVAYGNYLYFFTSYDYGNPNEQRHLVWRYDKVNEKWENIDIATEFFISHGAVIYDGSRYVYLIQGTNSTNMARFDLATHKITPETSPLSVSQIYSGLTWHTSGTGTSLVYDNSDNIYFFQGSSAYVNKYKISTKKWTRIADIPCIYNGSAVYADSTLYAFCGNTTKTGFKYNDANNNWIKLADSLDTMGAGGNQTAVWDGADLIYILRGRASATLYKYSISGDSWDTESASGGPTIGNSFGASITYDGSDNLYVVGGNANVLFYKYKISDPGKGWIQLTSLPEQAYYGSGSVYNDGKIYLMTGFQNRGQYIYDTATNTWGFGNFAPSQMYTGGAMTKGTGNTIYITQGNGNYTFWKYNIPTSSTSYVYKGTFTSAPINLGNPYDFAGLSATIASPSATLTTFETRTSTDSANWSDWLNVSGIKKSTDNIYSYSISSLPKKYIQVRATLESDESYESPTISDITVEYYNDQIAPDNPTTLEAFFDSSKNIGEEMTTNTWYNKATPYFEWSGAVDNTGGSGIAGYYVYFGTNIDAIASSSGTFQTEASFSATLATNGTDDGEYYLKILSVDNAGNVNPTPYSPFHYRYDHTNPTSVGTVSIDPRIYSSTNNFTMSWDAINDVLSNATSSGLFGYYYQASSSAVLINDIVTTEASISGILAYQEGSNTFNVRAVDKAGNTTSYKTASFYYNVTPPSAPTNLGVDTSNAGANKFAFTWGLPATIKGAVSEYRYAINEDDGLTEDNTSSTTSTIITGQKGTRSGSNTFYVVAVDEAGNVDYNNYASIDFDVNITAPGTPLAPESFDNSIRNTESYRVGLTWDVPTDLGSAFDRYEIYSSETDVECSTSMDSYSLVGSTAGTSDGGSYVVTALNNEKLESKDYYFCILACSSSNQCSSPSTTVTMLPTGRWLVAPDLVDEPTATVKTKSATVSWSTSRASNSFVKYGTSSGDYGNEVGSSEQEMVHTINLLNLEPGTTYYYKVLWSDEDGNQSESDEHTLTTTAAPFVSNVKFSNININSAYVTFTIKSASKATVQYGKTLSYGSMETISTSISETTYTVALDNLTEGTVHHLRIAGEDSEANIYYSDDYTFETLPTPKILNLRLQQVSGMATATLRLLWTSNTLISSIVTYYPTASPERAVDSISLALKKNHEVILKNLNDDTDYTLIIKGKDSAGNESQIETRKVKTSNDMRAPEIQNMNVEATIVGVGDGAKAQIVVSWDTDEPATTQVEYAQGTGTSYDQKTQEDSSLTTNHTVTITSLTPAKIYHLRASSKDKSGNIGQSFDTVIITPKSTKDALTLVIENLSKTFGFLNNLNIAK